MDVYLYFLFEMDEILRKLRKILCLPVMLTVSGLACSRVEIMPATGPFAAVTS